MLSNIVPPELGEIIARTKPGRRTQEDITICDLTGTGAQDTAIATYALKAAKATIVTAESCTAGTIAALLAQAEGASDILHGGFTTYTKEQKTKALDVSERLLKEQGAVNADVVKQLAAGALNRSPATISTWSPKQHTPPPPSPRALTMASACGT